MQSNVVACSYNPIFRRQKLNFCNFSAILVYISKFQALEFYNETLLKIKRCLGAI